MEHDRYYIDGKPRAEIIELDREESHHLIHVRRGGPGDTVTLFDGVGNEYDAGILGVRKGTATLRILASRAVSRELPCRLTLAFAPTKSQAMDDIVRQATEIGAAALQPLYCENSTVHYKDFARKCEKWRRTVIEACKQCGRNVLPVIATPAAIGPFLERCGGSLILIAHPAAGAKSVRDRLSSASKPESVICLVGPEGGFTEGEVALAVAAGARVVTLGLTRLRAETAAVTMLSAVTSLLR
jgi:16S rRNA (uracil1498-N3)-methyltransferase